MRIKASALAYLAQVERQEREQKDIKIIDANAKRLNREAMDTLEYGQLAASRRERQSRNERKRPPSSGTSPRTS